MIEREFVAQKMKEFALKKYIEDTFPKAGISQIKLKKIPLGEKIIISTSRPSVVVGSKGSNIKDLTRNLKKKFHLENPQVEINEIKDVFLDATLVAERIAGSLERYGSARFKSVGHKAMENVIKSGALGVEIVLSGKIPGARAKSWRFYQGYLKKCGDISLQGVRKAQASALLKSGIVGIKVALMPPDLVLPDKIEVLEQPQQKEETAQEKKSTKKTGTRKKSPRKKGPGKKAASGEAGVEKELPIEKADDTLKPESAEQKSESSAEDESSQSADGEEQ